MKKIYLILGLFLFCSGVFAENRHNISGQVGTKDRTATSLDYHAVQVWKASRSVEQLEEKLNNTVRATVFEFDLKNEREQILEQIENTHKVLKETERLLQDPQGRAKWIQLCEKYNELLRKSLRARTIYGSPNRLNVLGTKYHYHLSVTDVENLLFTGEGIDGSVLKEFKALRNQNNR